ncbi:MAG TPA: 3'(2'),5'-bisphosphate nucleotidase CysQ [Methylophilaceae bacterium]|nr:3'(2'),5'-bisphosphate nucleotidase CysQ [Methylophilaceae bacterium]
MNDLSFLMQEVVAIARNAGSAIMEVYASEIEVQHKVDNSPLTLADLAAHRIIESGLKQLMPRLPILSEESTAIPYTVRADWQRYWLVDPLDGTREFIKRNGEFTVNIALIDEGKPILGVVYAPAMDLLYFACCGAGAYMQKESAEPVPLRARMLDSARITIAGSRSHSNAKLQSFIEKVGGNLSVPALISLGSSLKICLVAEGKADVYPRLGPTSEWDTAAAQCVLEQAGGQLVDLDGMPLRYNSKESLLNLEFFARGATPHHWGQYLD